MPFEQEFQSFEYKIDGVRLPEMSFVDGVYDSLGVSSSIDNKELLRVLTRKGVQSKGLAQKSEYLQRAKLEIETYESLHFVDYILLVWDVVNFCKTQGIAVGLGRGSCVGSLVLYLIGVTSVDPLEHGLFFERFISKARAKSVEINGAIYHDGSLVPDVDLDISFRDREKVVKYIQNRFPNRVSKILTTNTLTGKAIIKESCKIVGRYSEQQANEISNMVQRIFGKVQSLQKVYEHNAKFKSWANENKDIFEVALKLEGLIKNYSVHASGYLVSHEELEKTCPLQLDSNGDLVSGFDMYAVSKICIKLDLLGVRSVTLVDDTLKAIGKSLNDADIYDQIIYDYLQHPVNPHGLFQLETQEDSDTSCSYEAVKKIKPKNFEHLMAVLALARPGAMEFIDSYASYVNEGVLSECPDILKDILNPTANLCLYQEQLLQMLVRLGLSKDEAELVRRCVGKKLIDEMATWEKKIYEAAERNGIDQSVAKYVWDIADASANYSFNKCLLETEEVICPSGKKLLKDVVEGDQVLAYNSMWKETEFVKVKKVYRNELEFMCKIVSTSGLEITASLDHKFLCEDGKMRQLKSILSSYSQQGEDKISIVTQEGAEKIESYHFLPKSSYSTVDLEVDSHDHNFFCNGIVVSNSHTAGYASLSAITIWLKQKYPIQFYLHLLKLTKHEQKPIKEISKIAQELKRSKIPLLGPHLLHSEMDFSIQGDSLRYGLSSIKGVSDQTIEKLHGFKHEYKNKFEIFLAAEQNKIGIGTLSALIQAGVLDCEGQTRTNLVAEAQLWNLLTEKEQKQALALGESCNYFLFSVIRRMKTMTNESGKPIMTEKRYDSLKEKYEPYNKIRLLNSRNENLANYFYEKKLLGYSYSQDLRDIFGEQFDDLVSISYINEAEKGDSFSCVAEVASVTRKKSAKGLYEKYFVSDGEASCDIMLFGEHKIRKMLEFNEREVEEGDLIRFNGTKGDGIVFLNEVVIQTCQIYTKLSEVKEIEVSD